MSDPIEDLMNVCTTAFEAMVQAFDRVWEDGEYLRAECCGQQVKYKSGLFGPDMAYCGSCGAEVCNVLSPHVSPVLVDLERHWTHAPSQSLIDRLGERCWLIKPKVGP